MKVLNTILLGLAATVAIPCMGDVAVPPIFADNMLLQRDHDVPIYGTASPGELVTVEFAGQKIDATADANGEWTATLKPMTASAEPREMVITGLNKLVLKNILVGDVWLASGQSNMELRLPEAVNAREEIAKADYPTMRFFTVAHALSSAPQTEGVGQWLLCTPHNAPKFSAAAYFFAREIIERYKVPIAIISCGVGSAGCECYVPEEVLRSDPRLPQPLKDLKPEEFTDWATYDKVRMQVYHDGIYKDPGIKPECLEWAKPDYDDSDWPSMAVPSSIKQKGVNIDGSVWFRSTVDVPADWDFAHPSMLALSFVQHNSVAYVNGIEIGRKQNDGREWVGHNYPFSSKMLHAGKNTIAVRITVEIGHGGFYPPYPRPLTLQQGNKSIRLATSWKYKVEAGREPQQLSRNLPSGYRLPFVLFNAMVHPYVRTPIKGFLWYQGESNSGSAPQHDILFPALITSWRKYWKDDSLPFYFVQLPNYMARSNDPNVGGGWAFFRESQAKALSLPHTGMAVTIDIGEEANVHPHNKQDVGRRLARWAGHDCYGDTSLEVCGPLFKSATVEGDKIRVKFDYVYGGLQFKDGKQAGFAIAGADKKFVWCDASIDGDSVVVSSPQVSQPQYVRYAWGMNPPVSLYNAAGLPAAPFRTDK